MENNYIVTIVNTSTGLIEQIDFTKDMDLFTLTECVSERLQIEDNFDCSDDIIIELQDTNNILIKSFDFKTMDILSGELAIHFKS